MKHRLASFTIALLAIGVMPASFASNPTTSPARSGELKWLTSLDAAYLQAQRTQQPMLLFIESRGDPACAQAFAELQSGVAPDPGRWVLARLDAVESRDALADLGVSIIPSIRLLTPSGRLTASLDEPNATESVSRWLETNRPPVELAPADAPTRRDLLAQLSGPNAAAREMAIRRLMQDRDSVGDVVETLFNGTMSARLASLDLLEQWGAPVGSIDPWNRSTLTEDRHKALSIWAKSPTTAPAPTTQASAADLNIEFDELISAPTAAEARAVRERLVRFGQAALPAVYGRLLAASTDTATQRLTALRYRLVATDRLAADWPGGFDRLASSDSFVRRAATDELAQHVNSDDSRLLVELFGDKDEFVRERSLRMLRAVGGDETNKALMKLLDDPEPNVRAAVLKTLAENPDPSLEPDLERYASSEKDADLVVHAIHVLQDIPNDESTKGIERLLTHPQWRVRAEACGAIHQQLMQRQSTMSAHDTALLIAALSRCLDDKDGFVRSQAAMALALFHLSPADDAIAKALDLHPEMAMDLLNSVEKDRDASMKILPAIRKLIASPNPEFRTAAIRAVCRFDPRNAGAEIAAGLKDSDASVCQSAALGMVTVLEQISPQNGTLYLEPGNYQTAQQNVDVKQWVSAFIQGGGRPGWMSDLKPDLVRLLKSADEPTRVAAAVSLCAMGGLDQAWPILQNSASSEISAATETSALPFLDWDQRRALFEQLVTITPDGQMNSAIEKFAMVPDRRAAAELWNLLRDPPRDVFLDAVHSALMAVYGIAASNGNVVDGVDPTTLDINKPVMQDAAAMLDKGGELQKTEALCLMYGISPGATTRPATKILDNKSNSPALRRDALQVLLLSLPEPDGRAAAVSAIGDPEMRKVAVPFLALGSQAVSNIRGDIYLNTSSEVVTDYGGINQNDPIIHVKVPNGLDAQPLLGLLSDPDSDMAGYAGYLVALLGDHRGIDPLLKAARTHGFDSDDWTKMVYRAITRLDDDSQTPILEEIYKAIGKNTWQIHEFYWTIRAMHGPNILKLRKKIRDEVGMAQLQ